MLRALVISVETCGKSRPQACKNETSWVTLSLHNPASSFETVDCWIDSVSAIAA